MFYFNKIILFRKKKFFFYYLEIMGDRKKTVFVVYYSMYGHLQSLAREICKGLEKSGGNTI